MRAIVFALLLAALAAVPAHAGKILFATAASQNAIDGFCVFGDGSLDKAPKFHIAVGLLPRRLVVKPDTTGMDGMLYVVSDDRVDAFRIGSHGGLSPRGETPVDGNMHPQDVGVSEDGRTIYVPNNGAHRIAAFPLDADGKISKDFTSCINGPVGPGYQRLVVRNGLLYVGMNYLGGRISIFPIAADGSLEVSGDPCRGSRGNADQTCPLAERRKLNTPSAFAISDSDVLYVESLAKRQIFAFQLTAAHLFTPIIQKNTGVPIDLCANEKKDKPEKGPFKFQKPLNKTHVLQQYHDMTLDMGLNAPEGVLYGSQFTHGRVDTYRIKSTGKLPKQPNVRTREDPLQTPVGLAVNAEDAALYVAGGELDKVQAFRLNRSKGITVDVNPFSETEVRKGSFPNALAVATLSDACQ